MTNALHPEVTKIEGKNGFLSVNYGDDRLYVVKPFKGRQGTTLTLKLGKYVSNAFGGILAGALEQAEGGTELEKMDSLGMMISGVLNGALSELDDPKFHSFFFELFTQVHRDNKLIDYDNEFQMEQGIAFDLVRHIVMYNFKSVFQQLGIDALLKKVEATE